MRDVRDRMTNNGTSKREIKSDRERYADNSVEPERQTHQNTREWGQTDEERHKADRQKLLLHVRFLTGSNTVSLSSSRCILDPPLQH